MAVCRCVEVLTGILSGKYHLHTAEAGIVSEKSFTQMALLIQTGPFALENKIKPTKASGFPLFSGKRHALTRETPPM